MKFKLMFLEILIFVGLLTLQSVLALPSDNATIAVTIGSLAQITLNDTDIDFGTVSLMGNSSIFAIKVTNTGSTVITNLYADADTLVKSTTNPRGTSTATNWAATTFLGLNNETTGNDYYYVGKLLWNVSNTEDLSGWTYTTGAIALGDFWWGGTSTGDLYYWQMLNGTSGQCNRTNALINITGTRGSKNTATGTLMTAATAAADWASFTVGSGPWTNYCVYAYYDCTKLYVTRWNWNTTFPACGGTDKRQYIHATAVNPSNNYVFRIMALIEPSVASGAVQTNYLRIFGTSS